MELKGTQDLFRLTAGDSVSKRNLFGLIQYSKVPGSDFWSGEELKIGNTPQQGINWVGVPPACRAVILKTRPGSYAEDGWTNEERTAYRYSFKARDGVISHAEKANAVLIHQPGFAIRSFFLPRQRISGRTKGRSTFRPLTIDSSFWSEIIRSPNPTRAFWKTGPATGRVA